MDLVGRSDRISPRHRDDAGVGVLIRVVVSIRPVYREPLLDVLYRYRRKEGLFNDRPKIPLLRQRPGSIRASSRPVAHRLKQTTEATDPNPTEGAR